MNRVVYSAWASAAFVSIAALIAVGLRVAPPRQASNSAESRQACQLDAPEPLRAAAAQWCAIGLFKSVTVTADPKNVIAVLQFSVNGADAWEMQSGGIMNDFRNLTDRLASDAAPRDVAVDVHDASDKRVAACARLTTEPMAKCEQK
jgi:hypothetical protein